MEANIKLKEIKINSSIKKYELKTTLLGYGNKGLPGKDGKDGATFTPSVDNEGNLSWTNDGNLDNPETKNIKGPKGDKGDAGAPGEPGPKGDAGKGVPNGGTIGQVLVKNSDTDNDTSWSNGTFIPLSPNNSTGNQYDLLLVPTGQYYITEAADVYWGTVQLTIPDDLWKTGTMLFIKTFQEELSIQNSTVLCNCSHILVVNRCSSIIGDTVMENIFCYKEVSGDNIGVIGYNIASVEQLNDAMSQVSETIQQLYDTKQDKLVSGTNIKTINNESILGEGNINIQGGSGGTTDYDQLENRPQINNVELSGNKSLSDLGITNFSGSYNDLSNKPNIPTKTSDLTNDSGFLANSIVELHGTTDNPVNLNTLEAGYYKIYGRYTIGTGTYGQDADKSTPFIVGDWGQYSSAIYKLIICCSGSGSNMIEYYIIKHEADGKYYRTEKQIQDQLISGTNIKTINNESLLGSGNLTITGGADIPIQATAPENPEKGDFWIDTSANGETYGDTLPIGAIVEYNGTTVPQGYEKVSDGSIIESGSNDNGNWIKYSDGTMMCTNRYFIQTEGNTTTQSGALYVSNEITGKSFPASFTSRPEIFFNFENATWGDKNIIAIKTIGYPTTSVAPNVQLVSTITSTNTAINFEYLAIGKWK